MKRRRVWWMAVLTAGFVCATAIAPFFAPFDPVQMRPDRRLVAPALPNALGTDEFGRDVLSRIMAGARLSFWVAVLSVAIGMAVGAPIGLVAGYRGGRVDSVLMRMMDVLFAFPPILLAISLIAVLGAQTYNVVWALAFVLVPLFARTARGPTIVARSAEYVQAAAALGAPHLRILVRHILPNISTALIVQGALSLSWAILTEAALGFLGLGVRPPHPSLGGMLNASRTYVETAPWTAIFPGLMIGVLVFFFNLLGDMLRDWLDPVFQYTRQVG